MVAREKIPDPSTDRLPEAIGQSDAFLHFQQSLSQVAPVNRPVLLLGERGTGKELAALRLHYLSKRWDKPLATLNCAALTPTLIESELFGYEAGAFTGAGKGRPGRIEAADGGSLFLDEIGNIPWEVQEKILRVVEYGTFERVGSALTVRVDVRIIGATNADLKREAEEGRFMRDLLDRLSFEVLFVPPLRARREDILLLANHFAARMAHELGRREVPEFSDETLEALESHPWPGNIRELKNVVERAVYRAQAATIEHVEFDPFNNPFAPLPASSARPALARDTSTQGPATPPLPADDPFGLLGRPFRQAVSACEAIMLKHALEEAKYNQRTAARILDLTYHQFRGLYRKHKDTLRHSVPGELPTISKTESEGGSPD